MEEHYIYQEYKSYLNSCDEFEKICIEQRLINQIIWYDTSAIKKQSMYKGLMICTIIFTAIIPILSLFTSFKYGLIATVLIALLSTSSSAILSILNLCEYRNLWVEYRSNCEMLKSILHRYFMKSNEFNVPDKKVNLDLLISSCEEYMTKEFQTWAELSHDYKKNSDLTVLLLLHMLPQKCLVCKDIVHREHQ